MESQLEKTVILVAKGHTVQLLLDRLKQNPNYLENLFLCCINSSYRLFPNRPIDMWCFNDIEASYDSNLNSYTINTIVLPYKLRGKDAKGVMMELNISYTELLDVFHPNSKVLPIVFPWQQFEVPPDVLRIGKPNCILSSTHTAVATLCELGFRKFEIYGVSKDGIYHNEFVLEPKLPYITSSWYKRNYELVEMYLQSYGCTFKIF
jgi:hypothetical protein